jgi:hypothetical protein
MDDGATPRARELVVTHCNILLSALATVMTLASIMPCGAAEEWTCGDSLGRMKQLGMLPTPATGSATGGSAAGGTAR